MNYLLLTFLGFSMASNQQHQIVGEMIDLDTGKIIYVLPERKNNYKNSYKSFDNWSKENMYDITFDEFKDLNSNSIENESIAISNDNIDTISCSGEGSCDGKVTLEKSTSTN